MKRWSRWILLFAVGAIVAIGSVGTAQAAKRRVPFGFFGTVLGPEYGDPGVVPDAALDGQMALMARSGVESLRVTFEWASIEPAQGVYDFTHPDRIVADAARHGISLLADLISTPQWASQRPSSVYSSRYAPRSPQLFADFATQLVKRYGPKGSFWKLHPRPTSNYGVRLWQIWNEQALKVFWATSPWPSTYTRVLRAAYLAIHHADGGAKVVAGSLVADPVSNQWQQAGQLYKAGAKRYFDVVSLHPFTDGTIPASESVNRVFIIVHNVRDVMRRNGDGGKPIILTELTWPAAVGFVPRKWLLGLETTPHGEALRMTGVYNLLATRMRQTGVTRAYWFSWASSFDASNPQSDVSYRFSGLVRFTNGAFFPKPILTTYAQLAARYEGCRKGTNAEHCG